MSSVLTTLRSRYRELDDPIAWLEGVAAVDVEQVINRTTSWLRSRKHHLPAQKLAAYRRSVVLGEFLMQWKKLRGGRSWEDLKKSLPEFELAILQRAVIATADQQSFRKVRKKLVRTRFAADLRVAEGDPEQFEGFVADVSEALVRRFYENFDPTRPHASKAAASYVQVMATSLFLDRRTRPVKTGGAGLLEYLESSARLRGRTLIAFKLAYFPYLLKSEELDLLEKQCGWRPSRSTRHKIKHIAERLGYPSGDVLSRKLYRVRKWCERWCERTESGTRNPTPGRDAADLFG